MTKRRCALSRLHASGGLRGFMAEPDPPPESTLKAVEKLGGRVTVGDVASKAGISLDEAKKQLTVLAQLADGNLEVSNDGELVYAFDGGFRSALSSRSAKRRLQETWDKVGPVLYYVLKVSFGVALLTSIALIFTTILVIQSSTRDERDERRSSSFGGGGGGFNMMYWWGPSPFDIFYYSSYQPYGVNRYDEPKELSFLESVFSFLFGDGDPNEKLEQRRAKAVAQLVREQGGSVIAEQLAPYMDPPRDYEPGETRVDEAFVLPAITELGGTPEVTEEGNIIYTFDDLQVSAAGTGAMAMLEGKSAKELKLLAAEEGVSTAGLFEKDDIVASLNAVLAQRGGGGSVERKGPYLEEQEYEFSLASPGQQLAVAALGVVNIAGALYLGNLFASPVLLGKSLGGLIGFVQAIYPALVAYGVGFLAVPAIRYVKVQRDNAAIQKRNRRRATWASALKRGGEEIGRKLADARERKGTLKVVKEADVEYSSGRSIEEQGLDLKQWDDQFKEGKKDQ